MLLLGLAPHGFFPNKDPESQDHQLKDGIAHSKLRPCTSIIDQAKSSTGESAGSLFSVRFPLLKRLKLESDIKLGSRADGSPLWPNP